MRKDRRRNCGDSGTENGIMKMEMTAMTSCITKSTILFIKYGRGGWERMRREAILEENEKRKEN